MEGRAARRWAPHAAVLLLALAQACGGVLADDTSLDASPGGDGAAAADGDAQADNGVSSCIPIGQRVYLAVGNPCIDISLPITLSAHGYTAWGGNGTEAWWSCRSASYSGCTVAYSDCSTPDGGSVYDSHCTPESFTLTWGSSCGLPYGPDEVACGSSKWSCSEGFASCTEAPAVVYSF